MNVIPVATWKPPQTDSIHKLNVANVAIFQSKKFTSVGFTFGVIIRNNKGEVLAASFDRVEIEELKSPVHSNFYNKESFTFLPKY